MDKLLTMILIACDPRSNPVAGLVSGLASQAWESLVQLTGTGDGLAPTGVDYTKNREIMLEVRERGTETGYMAPDGSFVSTQANNPT